MSGPPGTLAAPMAAGIVLFLLFATPSATAHHSGGHGEVVLRFEEIDRMVAKVNIPMATTEASFERTRMDSDADGNVTAEEAQARAESQQAMVAHGGLGLPFGLVYLDDSAPTTGNITAAYTGAVGPVASNASLALEWSIEYRFEANGSTDHRFQIDTGNRSRQAYFRIDTDSVSFHAPPGYVINGTGGLPWGSQVIAEDRVLVMPGIDRNQGWIDIGLSPAPARPASAEAPFPGFLAMFFGLVVTLAMTRSGRAKTPLDPPGAWAR